MGLLIYAIGMQISVVFSQQDIWNNVPGFDSVEWLAVQGYGYNPLSRSRVWLEDEKSDCQVNWSAI